MTDQVAAISRFLVQPDGGRVVMEGPLGVITKIPGTATNRVISIVEHPVAARILVPPHVHQDHDEWSYILEGRIGARVGDDEFIAEAGSYILKPRQIPHVFWNPDDSPARILEIITPSGLEEMFATFGELGPRRTDARDDGPDRGPLRLDDVDGLDPGPHRPPRPDDDGRRTELTVAYARHARGGSNQEPSRNDLDS